MTSKLGKVTFIGNHNPSKEDAEDWGKDQKDPKSQEEKTVEDKIESDDLEEVEAPPIIAPDEIEELEEDLKEEIRDAILNEFKAQGGAGAGLSSILFDNIVEVVESSKSIQMKAFEAFACDAKVNEIKTMFEKPRRTPSVVPIKPTNRELVMMASGITPVFWKNERIQEDELNRNIAVYLDVSGSVSGYLPKIMGVVANLRQNIKTVFCFSNIISEHSIDDMHQGKYKSSGGTDFDCIIQHAAENGIDKLIVFTDGNAWVSEESKKLADEKIVDVALIYFGYKNRNNFFQQKYDKNFELEELVR